MGLKTKVKVSGVTNLHDARYCAGMGVEMIGFQISRQAAGYIPPNDFNEIAGWLQGVSYVGEITSITDADLAAFHVQMLETDDPALLTSLGATNLPIILKIKTSDPTLSDVEPVMDRVKQGVDLFLLESDLPLSAFSPALLAKFTQAYDMLLGFGINAQNALQVIETIKPAGLALRPGKEIKVGLNDFDELADILESLETDEFS